jgi:hypothetical protein
MGLVPCSAALTGTGRFITTMLLAPAALALQVHVAGLLHIGQSVKSC